MSLTAAQVPDDVMRLALNGEEVTDYVRGRVRYYYNGSAAPPTYDVDANVTQSATVYESVGPTGSGATNIWTDLDFLPDDTVAVYLSATVTVNSGAAGELDGRILTRPTGSSWGADATYATLVDFAVRGTAASTTQRISMPPRWIPVDSSRRFDLLWDDAASSTPVIALALLGFETP